MQRFLFLVICFIVYIEGCEAQDRVQDYPNNLISEMGYETFVEDNGLMTVYQYDTNSKHCTAILRGYQHEWISRSFYFYDDQGFLERAISDNGQGQKLEDLTGVTDRQIIRLQVGHQSPIAGKPLKIESFHWEPSGSNADEELLYEVVFSYDQEGQLVSIVDNRGELTFNFESSQDLNSNIPIFFASDNINAQENDLNNHNFVEQISLNQIWNSVVNTFFYCFQYLQFSAHQTRMRWNAELQLPAPVAQSLEKIGKTLVGELTYLLMGPHFEETQIDCYGQREVNDKVRMTFINGILNTRSTLLRSLDTISKSHGGVKIHYVFRPTEGWTWDISRAVAIKTAYTLGFRSFHAHLLAKLWKELIQEMGGVEGGGVILHYAHSIGGSETDRARELLTPEEQKMIRVVTFGTSTLVRSGGFQKVTNVVSVNDGVSSFFLEPIGHIRNYFDPETNIRFLGSRSVIFSSSNGWPADHLLDSPVYSAAFRELGDEFVKEFILNKNENEL